MLDQVADIFEEPIELPPHRANDHAIPLNTDAKPINQRLYRLPHHHKAAMEDIIEQLIKSEVIRHSAGPYSCPSILVKKKDDAWRMCIDYR